MVAGVIRKPRNPEHVARMIARRVRQLMRRADCSPFGRKMVKAIGPDGLPRMIGVERGDEQGAYRAKHWRT